GVLGCVMLFGRAGAQPSKPTGSGAPHALPSASSASPVASSAPPPATSPPEAAEGGVNEDQMADTVVPDGGGVPIHTEGEFRSPFANPKWGTPAEVRVGLVLNDVTDYSIIEGSFNADFYLSLTSDKEMPTIDLIFPNGKPD